MRHSTGQTSITPAGDRHSVMGRTDLLGTIGNEGGTHRQQGHSAPSRGSFMRKAMSQGDRRVERPPAAAVRPTAILHLVQAASEAAHRQAAGQGDRVPHLPRRVPAPPIGHDLVKVYERNGIECRSVRCQAAAVRRGCTAATSSSSPRSPRRTSTRSPPRCGRGRDIVVPQPTCGYVLKKDYVDYVGGDRRRARRREHVRRRRVPDQGPQGDGTSLDTEFTGDVPDTVTYHTPCHLRPRTSA